MVHDSKSYKGARTELFPFINEPKNILDVGCNIGSTGKALKEHFGSKLKVHGIDYNSKSLEQAAKSLDSATQVNLNNVVDFESYLGDDKFDCIIFADTLEHILFPKKIVEIASKHLSENGYLIISLPNSGYYTSILNLLLHRWPANERGIYDKTHLKLYVANNLHELVPANCSMEIKLRKYRAFEHKGSKFDFLFKVFDYIPYFNNYFTFQFIIAIKPKH